MSSRTDKTFGQKIRQSLNTRLPDFQSIMQVFAVASMILYGWTLVYVTWKMGSWRGILTPGEIFSLISYLMVFNFLEASAVLIGLLGLCYLLPAQVFKEHFVSRGVTLVLLFLGSIMLHLAANSTDEGVRDTFVDSLRVWWLITFLLAAVLFLLIPKVSFAVKLLHEFSDRATIFLFILVPLSALGLIVIVARFFLLG